ncbi:MAG: 1-deoxy-D-xylulose-5-phosphate synthase [Candidatus Hydrogenedentes bacterium]|nr:1-deoxy-D-xylulose-5-phosphate synthase [Candidatus Hydrogenedentota bacterium]
MSLLDSINSPADFKAFSIAELEELARELRARVLDVVNHNGGHLSAPLGVVELTLALHYVFDVGRDQLIWDVGHQCYPHKLLTGRRDVFDTIRKKDGISGYPKISESPYDCFGTGHSSTSISAAVGMAVARDRLNEDYSVIALIGDGAITGGMALEGLSHAGHLGLDMLVILNDNEMSISPNASALNKYFNRLIMAEPYKRAKEDAGSFVKKVIGNRMTRAIQDIEKSVKGYITKGALFQELGVNYLGPVDGHDLPLLIECLTSIKSMHGPILLHCRTEKGKGLKAAEEDPLKYHGVSPRAIKPAEEEGEPLPNERESQAPPARSFTDAFVEGMLEAGAADERVVGITAAMPTGTGLSRFEEAYPDRFFDVGICEQHAVTMAAGMAAKGLRPVAAIYSTFLQRGYDQLIHDVCIQKLPVVFAIDRAGLVGEDSPTQNGTFDISFLRCIPDLQVLAPRDDVDTRLMLRWALQQDGPIAIRYARGSAPTIGAADGRDIARGEVLREGTDATFLALGPCLKSCIEAAERLAGEGYSVGVADARFVKPLDAALLDSLIDRPIITVEENTLDGGFGSAVLEHFANAGRLQELRIHRIGIPDVFSEQATRSEQLEAHDLHSDGLYRSVSAYLRAQAAEVAAGH